VNRIRPDDSVAGEPTTIAAIISLSATATYAVARLLEKWLEIQREKSVRGDVMVAWASDPKLAKELLEMEKKHSDVVVKARHARRTDDRQAPQNWLEPRWRDITRSRRGSLIRTGRSFC